MAKPDTRPKKPRRGVIALASLVMAALIVLSVNVLASTLLRDATIDLTEKRLYTLSEGTHNVLRSLDEPVTVRAYFSSSLGERAPVFRQYFDRIRTLLEEYAAIAGGKLRLEFYDPEPFSDEEDLAVGAGLQGIPLGEGGELGYFGLVGTNSTDTRLVMPVISLEREPFLEYDLTKLVYSLAFPEKKTVGLISGLPVAGGRHPQFGNLPQWRIIDQVREFFDLQILRGDVEEIPDDVDVLMVVQPVGLSDATLYAIDQYALSGGSVLAFVDPNSEVYTNRGQGLSGGRDGEGFERLLAAWGVELVKDRIAADRDHARRIQFGQGNQPVITDYVAWLALGPDALDTDDVAAAGIERLHLATAGILQPIEDATTEFASLLTTGPAAMTIEADAVRGMPDPVRLLEQFQPGGEPLTLAARVTGEAKSAFDGPPAAEEEGGQEAGDDGEAAEAPAREHRQTGRINTLIFADADMLYDNFWVSEREFLGQRILVPQSNNADLVLNAIDNLTGGEMLIGLRGRGIENRPFDLVEDIRRDAEQRYRQKEQALVANLKEVQDRLADIQKQGQGGDGGTITVALTEEDRSEIERMRLQMIAIRKELRDVKHALRRDIDRIELATKFVNIAGVPLLIGIGGVAAVAVRRRRRHRKAQQQEVGSS